jgi:hypothetical protein
VAGIAVLASRRNAVLPSSSLPLRISNQISWAPRQTFRELRRKTYSHEASPFSECVRANPTFLAQAVSISRPFKIFLQSLLIFTRDSREFDTISWTVYLGFCQILILYLMKHSSEEAQSLVSGFLRNVFRLKMCRSCLR